MLAVIVIETKVDALRLRVCTSLQNTTKSNIFIEVITDEDCRQVVALVNGPFFLNMT